MPQPRKHVSDAARWRANGTARKARITAAGGRWLRVLLSPESAAALMRLRTSGARSDTAAVEDALRIADELTGAPNPNRRETMASTWASP